MSICIYAWQALSADIQCSKYNQQRIANPILVYLVKKRTPFLASAKNSHVKVGEHILTSHNIIDKS